jgi:hypothetical protein
LTTVLCTIPEEYGHECLDDAVTLLNADPIHPLTDDRVPGHKGSVPGLPATKFLAPQVWDLWFFVTRYVSDADMPGALVPDEMGL